MRNLIVNDLMFLCSKPRIEEMEKIYFELYDKYYLETLI